MLSNSSIPYQRALFLAKRMDIREVRRQNLAALRSELGSVRALADRVDTDPNYLSQILGGNGKHHMGHAMARRLESALHKPEGWMDQVHDQQEQENPRIKNISRMAKMLTPKQQEKLEEFIQSMIPRNQEQPPSLERRAG